LLSEIIFILAVTFMCMTLFLFWQYHRRQARSSEYAAQECALERTRRP
jgi:hypothetical protein